MKKNRRKWVKDEKRLIKLLYRTGILDKNQLDINNLYWSDYDGLPKVYLSKNDYLDTMVDYHIIQCIIDTQFKGISRRGLIKTLSNYPITKKSLNFKVKINN